jgi:hypothetical protein
MKAVRLLAVLLAACLVVSSCGEPPASPQVPAPQAGLIGAIIQPTGLLQCSDLPSDSDTETIGPAGGRLTAGPHTLFIPAGALDEPTKITMSVRTGSGVNAVHFEPEGLQFERSASLTMSYANCDLLGKLLPKRIAYADDALNIVTYLLSLDNLWTKRVTGKLDHFSDYVVAW